MTPRLLFSYPLAHSFISDRAYHMNCGNTDTGGYGQHLYGQMGAAAGR
jgi:hypothetical protein